MLLTFSFYQPKIKLCKKTTLNGKVMNQGNMHVSFTNDFLKCLCKSNKVIFNYIQILIVSDCNFFSSIKLSLF